MMIGGVGQSAHDLNEVIHHFADPDMIEYQTGLRVGQPRRQSLVRCPGTPESAR